MTPDVSAWISSAAAVVSIIFAWRAHTHSKNAHADLRAFEQQKLELEKEWRREDRDGEAKAASEERICRFIDCMTKANPTGLGSSLDCGLAALESDEEIRRANAAYKQRKGKSVFFGYEHLFDDIDARAALANWRTMSPQEQKSVGGMDQFLMNWPKKSEGST